MVFGNSTDPLHNNKSVLFVCYCYFFIVNRLFVFTLNCRKTELTSLTAHSQATLYKANDIFVKISQNNKIINVLLGPRQD